MPRQGPALWQRSVSIIVCLSLFLLFTILIACQNQQEVITDMIEPEDLPHEIDGWALQDSARTFDHEGIFTYINGAGEVYLAYDFQQVRVFEYLKDSAPRIAVEIFDMGSDMDAYGIFSHGREDESDSIGNGYEYQAGLLCFWQSNFFVCLQAEQETPEARDAIHSLAHHVSGKLLSGKPPMAGVRPELVSKIPEDGLDPLSVRFFHKHTSLNYHYYLTTDNLFGLDKNTQAVIAEYGDRPMYLLVIQYPTSDLAQKGYDGFINGYLPEAKTTGVASVDESNWVAVEHHDHYVVVVFDAVSESAAMDLLNKAKIQLGIPLE